MEKVRHYIVKCDKLQEAHKTRHSEILVDRPTPWKLFFSGFFSRDSLGFVIMRDEVLDRFLSNSYACFFDGKDIKSNGDIIHVQKWSLLNVMKFCLEGFQYSTFLKFWEWTWKE